MATSYSMQDLQLGRANSQLWHAGSSSLTRDGTPAPLHWELGVLATGPPRESQTHCFLTAFPSCLQSFLPLRSLITETCLRASIVARFRSQNLLDQNEVKLDYLSPGTPLPYLLTTPNVDIKEISSYFNQIIRCSGPNSRLLDLYSVYFLRLPRWLKW